MRKREPKSTAPTARAGGFPQTLYDTGLKKRRVVGLALLAILLTLFLIFNRIPKLDTVEADLAAAASPKTECFQGFCFETDPDTSLLSRWWDFSLTYLRLVTLGMVFAFLVAGVTEVFLFPKSGFGGFASRGIQGSLKGLLVGPAMNLCSACIVPVASAFRRRGAGIEATLAIAQGSSTLNLPAMIMAVMVFAPLIGGSRIALSIVGAILIGPIVAKLVSGDQQSLLPESEDSHLHGEEDSTWGEVLSQGLPEWGLASLRFLIRLGPIMVAAGFASGLAIQWISPDTVTAWLGDDLLGIGIAATLGVLINVPLLFEIPLVAALLLAGMGTAPAATLLFAAAAGGPVTFWGLAKVMPGRAIMSFGAAIWVVGLVGGMAVLGITTVTEGRDFGLRAAYASPGSSPVGEGAQGPLTPPPSSLTEAVASSIVQAPAELDRRPADADGTPGEPAYRSGPTAAVSAVSTSVRPFVNIAPQLGEKAFVVNFLPGVGILDYDRDGRLDFYVTQEEGHPNYLFHNEGDGAFAEVARQAGVDAVVSNSTGVAVCDVDNDGYQDLYVAAQGRRGDEQDYSAARADPGLRDAVVDRLFLNNGDGTFKDVTASAFGDAANTRTGVSPGCADVDLDGWLDIFVANRSDVDQIHPDRPTKGNANVLYRNNGDLTFSEIADAAGVRGEQVTTWASLFFDYDSDGDPDLWAANDGGRLNVYRNDTRPGVVAFTDVARAMGIDKVGSWMGFALGDYDGDVDLDVFVTNLGYHPRMQQPQMSLVVTGQACHISQQYEWSTCDHFLLRNDGVATVPRLGSVGLFADVAPATFVQPSRLIPPLSIDPLRINPSWQVPTGLAAYDFGFGAAFFDYENDGDQDLYWLGSTIGRGEGLGGHLFPSAGRMLVGDGKGSFRDLTIEAHLLDIQNVDYSILDRRAPGFDPVRQRLLPDLHENGKGLAKGDLNGDGFTDLIATNSSGGILVDGETQFAKGPIFVWINPGGEDHWITLRLRGRMAIDGAGSNADGIGARVFVTAKVSEGRSKTQVAEVLGSSSFVSMSSTAQSFGLGEAEVVDSITVFWPSGVRQVLRDLPADQVVTIEEPAR